MRRGQLHRGRTVVFTSHPFARKLQTAFGPDIVISPGYRKAPIEVSIATNAALAAFSTQEELRSGELAGIQAVYGVYLLETRQIWAPRIDGPDGNGLAAAPRNLAGFVELGEAIVKSQRIKSLFDAGIESAS